MDVQCLVDIATIISGFAAAAALVFAGYSLISERKKMRNSLFSDLLKEVGSDKARRDRGLVKRIPISEQIETNKETFRQLIEHVRKQDDHPDREIGEAAEFTVARLDRVGLFLLADHNKPIIKPPKWLWTIVNENWKILGQWVEFRQSSDSGDNYYHEGYGYYFQKLANYKHNGEYYAK